MTTIEFDTVHPQHDIWLNLRVFYRVTQNNNLSLAEFDGDICCGIEETCNPGLLTALAIKAVSRVVPEMIHKCPYVGKHGMYDIDFDKIVAPMLPHVVPIGEYVTKMRFYTKSSDETIASFMLIGDLGPINGVGNVTQLGARRHHGK